MDKLPLALPSGFYRNGAAYGAKGRWRDGSLTRFVDGKPRAIGGWIRRTKSSGGVIPILMDNDSQIADRAPRGIFAWRTNENTPYGVIGLTDTLIVMEEDGDTVDITPSSDFIAGTRDSTSETGYGTGEYGAESFGTPRQGTGLKATPVGQWRFDAWGEDLLAASPLGPGTALFSWEVGEPEAVIVPNAPTDFYDFCVTNERIVMALCPGREVKWSDTENREEWTPAITNQAGSRVLPGTGALLACARVGTDILIVSENDAYVARYIGPPYIYGFSRVGDNCGILCANALVVDGVTAYWWDGRRFFRYSGAVETVPCEVGDFLAADLDIDQSSKTYGYTISEYGEIGWLYQSNTDPNNLLDPNMYVAYNPNTGDWTTSYFERSVYLDAGVFGTPIAVRYDGRIYNHELRDDPPGSDIEEETPWIRTGPVELNNGANTIYLHEFIPAEVDPSSILTVYARDAPNSEFREYGPYSLNLPITPIRGYGKEIELRIESNEQAAWILDNCRISYTIGGDR